MDKAEIDLNSLIIKPIYAGMGINVFIPVVLMTVAYFMDPEGARTSGTVASNLTTMFWIFIAVALSDGLLAFFFKNKLFNAPMVFSKETFVEDMTSNTLKNSIICFILTASISIYGFIYFLIEGTMHQLILFIVISFISFQLVKPRPGFIGRVVDHQIELVNQGKFKQPLK